MFCKYRLIFVIIIKTRRDIQLAEDDEIIGAGGAKAQISAKDSKNDKKLKIGENRKCIGNVLEMKW